MVIQAAGHRILCKVEINFKKSMSGRGGIRGRRRISAEVIRQVMGESEENEEVECLVVARSLWLRGRAPSEASDFTEENLDQMIRRIASSPSEPLSLEEEGLLPRPESPHQAEQPVQAEPIAPSQEVREVRPKRSREWCMEQVRQQIASKARTPGYWGKTAAKAGRCGYCVGEGHNYFNCPIRINKNKKK
ncbi:uncharacterized protein LOC127279356 [Leptopilina boulardi]|uniref:uncharacterized protein LOC127279356 n=1 Tax=Leptopilina boulardi TaxID=63433 RepID=UPI0021F4FE90|nr:uncharacterized protein LOC127279356 [Leptopilina boulardi]